MKLLPEKCEYKFFHLIDPEKIAISDYTYVLPNERIALHPLPERDQSRLLIWENKKIRQDIFKNITDYLPPNSLLVFNDTKVIQARILFKKSTGAVIEIFCLEPYEKIIDYETVMAMTGSVKWKCMIGGAGKWKSGSLEKSFTINNEPVKVKVTLKEKLPDSYVAEFSWQPQHHSFAAVLEHAGKMPLPPYIKRDSDVSDIERYQTVYAKYNGSVAAPTAGLHFTPAILSSLKKKKIKTDFVTLHVGAGTFKPVKTPTLELHQMHAELIDVSISTIENIIENISGKIIAVGTTSLRTLETLYWMGVKCALNPAYTISEIEIKQWDVYHSPLYDTILTDGSAVTALLNWMKKNKLERLVLKTEILIAPGYVFKIVDGLITNFHQPNSTLLLLVAAAVGDDWKNIYNYALENDFRFLSYGDGCLLLFTRAV